MSVIHKMMGYHNENNTIYRFVGVAVHNFIFSRNPVRWRRRL